MVPVGMELSNLLLGLDTLRCQTVSLSGFSILKPRGGTTLVVTHRRQLRTTHIVVWSAVRMEYCIQATSEGNLYRTVYYSDMFAVHSECYRAATG